MPVCPNCGHELGDDFMTCPSCLWTFPMIRARHNLDVLAELDDVWSASPVILDAALRDGSWGK